MDLEIAGFSREIWRSRSRGGESGVIQAFEMRGVRKWT